MLVDSTIRYDKPTIEGCTVYWSLLCMLMAEGLNLLDQDSMASDRAANFALIA
jgi:hypothetical protein